MYVSSSWPQSMAKPCGGTQKAMPQYHSWQNPSVSRVTMSEFFYRCSTDFPQIEYGTKKDKDTARLWYGQAWNLDEAYEMLESLSLLGCPGDKARSGAVNPHASTLNTLIQRGKTKRATRTSTTYEGNSSQHISLSILGNAHPSKIIAMERALQGQHTAATKERFLLCVDHSVARHDALPQSMLDADPDLPQWTWLPLTPLQATVFGWTDVVGNPSYFSDKADVADEEHGEEGFPMTLPDGVPSRARFVAIAGGPVSNSIYWCLTCSVLAPLPCFSSSCPCFLLSFAGGLQTEFRISGRWHMQDPTKHLQSGAKRVADFFRGRPHSVLAMEETARKMLLGGLE